MAVPLPLLFLNVPCLLLLLLCSYFRDMISLYIDFTGLLESATFCLQDYRSSRVFYVLRFIICLFCFLDVTT